VFVLLKKSKSEIDLMKSYIMAITIFVFFVQE